MFRPKIADTTFKTAQHNSGLCLTKRVTVNGRASDWSKATAPHTATRTVWM